MSLKGLVFDDGNNAVATATILMPEQLNESEVELRRDDAAYVKRFDPIAGGPLLFCLNWTGPKNPMGESAMSARNGASLKADCESAAAQTKFVVVVETASSVVPTLVTDGQFVGGAADVRVTVLEFSTQKVLSRFEVHGQPNQVIKYRRGAGDRSASRLGPHRQAPRARARDERRSAAAPRSPPARRAPEWPRLPGSPGT